MAFVYSASPPPDSGQALGGGVGEAVGGVAAAQKLIGGNQQTVTTSNPQQGTTTTAGTASNQAIYDVSRSIVDTVGRIINNTIDLNPVVRIPQGTRITVIVNSDIKIPSMEKN